MDPDIQVSGWLEGEQVRCCEVLDWPQDVPTGQTGQPSPALQAAVAEFLRQAGRAGLTPAAGKPVGAALALRADGSFTQTLTLSAWFNGAEPAIRYGRRVDAMESN